ncbi:ribonuclease h [Plakobranchus ocellatus]|uniref:Ribonuclease h n=1 Tax=Plakobranchus ocellatus TaxID=259542 RepID=A0AAV4D1C7_9GAST|nr:ribonuclease h [Plakobranchus ocellatus]
MYDQIPGVVILTDCRALVQALGGSGSEGVGEAVLLADYLLKTEGVQTVVQWIPSHVWVLGNEIADGLANEGRSMPQPRKPLFQTLGRSCNAALPISGVPLSYLMMNDSPVSMKPMRRVIIYKVCQGVTLYKYALLPRNITTGRYLVSGLWASKTLVHFSV